MVSTTRMASGTMCLLAFIKRLLKMNGGIKTFFSEKNISSQKDS